MKKESLKQKAAKSCGLSRGCDKCPNNKSLSLGMADVICKICMNSYRKGFEKGYKRRTLEIREKCSKIDSIFSLYRHSVDCFKRVYRDIKHIDTTERLDDEYIGYENKFRKLLNHLWQIQK